MARPTSPRLASPTDVCASCGDALTGPFCARCGEQVVDRHSLTLGHFLTHGVVHELTHLDGKIFHTFRCLLFRPGFLSEEYFAGRRRGYINPVRLLLTVVVLFALVGQSSVMSGSVGRVRLNLLPPGPPTDRMSIADTAQRLDPFGVLSRPVARASATNDLQSEAAVEKFHHELKTYGTALSFSIVVLLAGLLFVMFHRRRPLFVEHLIFSLHLASFVLLLSIISGWVARAAFASRLLGVTTVVVVSLLFLVVQIVYLHQALLRFYFAQGYGRVKWWSRSAWLAKVAVLVVFLGNSLFITVVYTIGAAIALARL